jgi:hypothetical protein
VLCGSAAFRPSATPNANAGSGSGASELPEFGTGVLGMGCDYQVRVVDHIAGTCRMGPFAGSAQGAQGAAADTSLNVVSSRTLAVHGVQRLRVADASVMPSLPAGNTHASCVMIGEKAAQLIIDTYAHRQTHSQDSDHSNHDSDSSSSSATSAATPTTRSQQLPVRSALHSAPVPTPTPATTTATATATASAPPSSPSSAVSEDAAAPGPEPVHEKLYVLLLCAALRCCGMICTLTCVVLALRRRQLVSRER